MIVDSNSLLLDKSPVPVARTEFLRLERLLHWAP